MADLLPSTADVSAADEADPRVVGLDSEDADDLLAALSSTTARELFSALHEEPSTPSALSDRVDTSLQNTQYHLEKLENADLVEVVDTAYSEKGREMDVYAPKDKPLVVFAGDEDESGTLRTALSRLLGGVGLLAGASLVVERLFGVDRVGSGSGLFDRPLWGEDVEADRSTTDNYAGDTEPQVDMIEFDMSAADAGAGLPPGLLFFAGGAFMLACTLAVWYWRVQR